MNKKAEPNKPVQWTEKAQHGGTRNPGADADYSPIPAEIERQRDRKRSNNHK